MRFYITRERMEIDKFIIKDEDGNNKYKVEGEKKIRIFSKFYIYDSKGKEVACIEQKFGFFSLYFNIYINGEYVTKIYSKFPFLKLRYVIKEKNWTLTRNFLGPDKFKIYNSGNSQIADITKKWLSIIDSYIVDIDNKEKEDEIIVLSIVLAIHETI